MRAVVGGIEHDGVVGDTQFIELLSGTRRCACRARPCRRVFVLPEIPRQLPPSDVGAEMHARAAPPDEEGLVGLDLLAR